MANSINSQVSVTSVVDGVRTTISSNIYTNTSSSNFLAGSQDVTGSAFTAQTFTGLNDVVSLTVVNDNTVYSASIIQISSSAAGNTLPLGAILIPGAQAVIPWSGSLTQIATKVVGYGFGIPGATNPVQGVGSAQAGKGTIQFLVQQS